MTVQAQAVRSSLHKLEGLPEEHSPLTTESREKSLDGAIKFGTAHQSIGTWSYPIKPAIPSPPSYLFSQYIHTIGHASAGVHPQSPHRRSHSDSRYHQPTYPTQYARDRSQHYAHAQPKHHSSQSGSRRLSAGGGPRVANFIISPALAYPSHSQSEPRHTQTRSILRNREGPPLGAVVSHLII